MDFTLVKQHIHIKHEREKTRLPAFEETVA